MRPRGRWHARRTPLFAAERPRGEVVTPHGAFVMTKADFGRVFPNVLFPELERDQLIKTLHEIRMRAG